MRPASNSFPAAVIASPASRRFVTSLRGSCKRKISIPFSAALATKRGTKSLATGREPTRKRPRSARPSGVWVRALIARIRSHGLSTPRRTALSNTPPPETSSSANPARSRTSARRSNAAVGMRPASGSWPSRRIDVSTSAGTRREGKRSAKAQLRARDVAPLARIDLDPLALRDEERHLHDGSGLERRGLRHVRDGVPFHARLGVRHLELDRRRQLDAGRPAVHREDLHRRRGRDELEVGRDALARKRELLVRDVLHEDDLVARVVEEL